MTTVPAPIKPSNLPGRLLEERDFQALEARWISRAIAEAAHFRRITSLEGAEAAGQHGSGDYSGILIPNFWPGETRPREYRVRRDHPDFEFCSDGSTKPRKRYVGPPGRSNLLYFPPGLSAGLLARAELPMVITEGEFKALALYRLAWHGREGAEDPAFVPGALTGVWSWRGVVGKTTDAAGNRCDVKGPIPDLSRLVWTDRLVIIIFDSDSRGNLAVEEAARQLQREICGRGAEVALFPWPKDTAAELKGIDDFLAARGPEEVLGLLGKARARARKKKVSSSTVEMEPQGWRAALIRNTDGKPAALLANAITAFRGAPELEGAVAFDDFAFTAVATRGLPWAPDPLSSPRPWLDHEDILAAEWLQREGIHVSREIAGQAIEAVSRERSFHPVRDYLNGLEWDGVPRLDNWPAVYLGVQGGPEGGIKYLIVGARFLISAVARVMRPGCKADHCLILEHEQGRKKSTAVRTLAYPWYADEISDLGSKDSAMQVRGVWILELAELDAMSRPEAGRVKAFMSRATDHFRPPYGRRVIDLPRQCVFCGTVNRADYLIDETGGRRFWPLRCGQIDVEALARDRDLLWAEAVARFRAGEPWWLETGELVERAQAEQAARYQPDAWQALITQWATGRIESGATSVSVSEGLDMCLGKPKGQWTRADAMRVGRCLTGIRWERFRDRKQDMEWRYRPPVPT